MIQKLQKLISEDPNIKYFDRDKIFSKVKKKDLNQAGLKRIVVQSSRDSRYTLHYYLKLNKDFNNTISFQFAGCTQAAYKHLKTVLGDSWKEDFTGKWKNVAVTKEDSKYGYNHYTILHNNKILKANFDDDWQGWMELCEYGKKYTLEYLIHPLYSLLLFEGIIKPHQMSIGMKESLICKQSRGMYSGYKSKDYYNG